MKTNIMKIAIICLFTLLPLKAAQLTKKQRNEIIELISKYSIITQSCATNSNLSICSNTPGSAIKEFMSLLH